MVPAAASMALRMVLPLLCLLRGAQGLSRSLCEGLRELPARDLQRELTLLRLACVSLSGMPGGTTLGVLPSSNVGELLVTLENDECIRGFQLQV
eukprot:scaffold4013_cov429-Prasinococcus_capsulatus_cf.AAC.12